MNKQGHIDLEKISTSIDTLSSIENIINIVDLSDSFEDIEKCFRQLNFEHSNCLKYKDSLSTIYADLEIVKRKTNELAEALKRTKLNYTKINSFSDKDIKEFTEIYKATPASEDLSKLVGTKNTFNLSDLSTQMANPDNSSITTVPLPETTPVQNKPVDTLPIGVAIGATGIAGSIGAVLVDDVYSKREKYHKVKSEEVYLEDFKEPKEEILTETEEPPQNTKKEGIAQGPYHAVRLDRESDHYYGNQLSNMDVDDEYAYFDEDDDYDEDDFEEIVDI
ncbi:MAG: hypothetical protein IKF71_00610 [Bacilli bacterium]|nr:hypothetical protein [Bacilli bacterium]